jgi:hypothetical protein
MALLGHHLAVHDHLVQVLGVLARRGRIITRMCQPADDRAVGPQCRLLPLRFQRLALSPQRHDRGGHHAAWQQMSIEAPQRFIHLGRFDHQLQRAGRDQDGSIAPGQGQRLHGLLVQVGRQRQCTGLFAAQRQHLRRVVYAVYVNALRQVIQQQPAGAATHVQHRLAGFPDHVQVEETVGPGGGVPAQQIPCLSHQAAVLVVGHHTLHRR